MIVGSIHADNLEPLLTALGWLIGYSFHEDDRQAIDNDLLDGGGGSYRWVGNQTLRLEVAVDRDPNFLNVKVDPPEGMASQVELAVAIFQHFRLRKPRY